MLRDSMEDDGGEAEVTVMTSVAVNGRNEVIQKFERRKAVAGFLGPFPAAIVTHTFAKQSRNSA